MGKNYYHGTCDCDTFVIIHRLVSSADIILSTFYNFLVAYLLGIRKAAFCSLTRCQNNSICTKDRFRVDIYDSKHSLENVIWYQNNLLVLRLGFSNLQILLKLFCMKLAHANLCISMNIEAKCRAKDAWG
jgi:hypothetical protein